MNLTDKDVRAWITIKLLCAGSVASIMHSVVNTEDSGVSKDV